MSFQPLSGRERPARILAGMGSTSGHMLPDMAPQPGRSRRAVQVAMLSWVFAASLFVIGPAFASGGA